MKKKVLSIALALVMSLSCLPTAVFAEDDHDHSTVGETTEIKDEITEDVNEDGEIDVEVALVQAQINSLPNVEDVTADDYDTVSDVYDAYLSLTEKQQSQIVGAEVFEELFGWFNSQTQTLEEVGETTSTHTHYLCKNESCNGVGGHSCSSTTFLPWESSTSLPSSGCYYLTTDVTVNNLIKITSGDLILCLNGKKITLTNQDGIYKISGNTSISITDCLDTGKITSTTKTAFFKFDSWDSEVTTILNLYRGHISNGYNAILVGGISAKFYMYGGKISDCTNGVVGGGSSGPEAYIYGGQITGNGTGVDCTNKLKLIVGGTANITGNFSYNENTNIEISSPESITIKDDFTGLIGINTSKIYQFIENGKVYVIEDGANIDNIEEKVLNDVPNKCVIKHENGYGTVSCLHRELTASDIKCYHCHEQVYISKPIDKGTQYYLSFSDALNDLKDGETLSLVQNVTLDSDILFDKNFTLDLNGKSISYGSENSKDVNFNASGKEVTIKDSASAKGSFGESIVVTNGTLTLSDGVTLAEGKKITVNGGKLKITNATIPGKTNERDTITVNGGVAEISGGNICSLNVNPGGNAVLSGGEFVAIYIDNNDESSTRKLTALLYPGYAYKLLGEFNKWLDESKSKGVSSGSHIGIFECVHENIIKTDTSWDCIYCARKIMSSVLSGNSTTERFFVDISDTFAALDNGSVLTLNSESTDTETPITVKNKNFTFITNNKKLLNPITFENSTMIIGENSSNVTFGDLTIKNSTLNPNGLPIKANSLTFSGEGTSSLSSGFTAGSTFTNGINLNSTAKVTVNGKKVTSLIDLVDTGYAFYKSDDTIFNEYNNSSTNISLTVKPHTCENLVPVVGTDYKACEDCGRKCYHGTYTENGMCTVCGFQMKASLTENGTITFHEDIQDAVDAVKKGNSKASDSVVSILKAETDAVNEGNMTKKITASGKTFTLNLKTDLYADIEFKNCNVSITSDGNNKEIKGKVDLSGGEEDKLAMTINGVSFDKEFISNISFFSSLNMENVIFKKQVTIHHGITEFKNFDIQDDLYIDNGKITFNGGKFSGSQSGITIVSAKVSLSGITEAKASIQLGNNSGYYPSLTVSSDNCKFENTISVGRQSTLEFYGDAELIQVQGGDALLKGGSISTIKTVDSSVNGELKIESCSVGSLEIENCTTIAITLKNGSSFGNITITADTDKNIADFIAEGHALADSTTNALVNSNTKTISSAVKVVPHATHNDVNGSTGYCGCGKIMLITVKNDGEERTYYTDIFKAIDAVNNGGTLTLLGDIDIGNIAVNINKKLTFDIVRRNINTTSLVIGENADVTLKGSYNESSSLQGNINSIIRVRGGKISIQGINLSALVVEEGATPSNVNLISGKYSSILVNNGTIKDTLGSDSAFKSGTQWIKNPETMSSVTDVIVEKTPISSSAYIDTPSTEIEYGNDVSLEAKIAETSLQGVTYKWTKTVGTKTTTLGTEKTQKDTHPDIGTIVYKCDITCDGFTRTIEKTVTISPITITEDILTVNDLVFLPDAESQSGDGKEQNANFTVTGLVKDTDYEVVSGDKGTDVDTYTLKIKGIGNYKGEISKTWKITPFELSGITVNIYDDERVYDGTTAVNIVGIELVPKNNNTPLSSVDFTGKLSTNVTAKYSDASVGTDKDVEVKINLGSNYVYNNENIVTLTKKADIHKASASSKTGAVLTVKNDCANTYTFDLSTLLPDLAKGCSFGDVSYEVTASTVSPVYYSKGDESIENGVLTIPVKEFETSTEASIGKITIKVTTANYTVSDIEIELKAVNKIPLTGIPILNTSTVYYGDKISKITISGDVKDTLSGNIVSGSFAWKNDEMVFDTIGDITVYWVFTPTDTMTYSSLESYVTITVKKAVPTGAPSYTAITSPGKILSDANIGFGTLSVDKIPGNLSWDDPTDTPVEQEKAYGWTFTPHNPDFYEVLKGNIVLWKKPASSGGGGGGGSAAKPVSKNDGNLEIKTEVSNGTATIEVSDKQIEEAISGGKGSIIIDVSSSPNVTEIKLPSKVIEKIKQDGNTSITIKLPTGSITLDEKALESLSGKDDVSLSVKTVALVELSSKESSALGNSVKVAVIVDMEIVEGKTIKSTFGNGKLTITIPYTPKSGENVSKLSVWYIRDDGTIEVKGGKYDPKTQTFSFETEHLSRFILVNTENTKLFVDVPANAYYTEAVNWASESGITGGIGNNMFAPDLSCTRAQIVSFLWRAAGCPEPKSTLNSFTDVKSNEYYYKAVLWAVEEGITSGTSEGKFSPNDACTRAQAVCFIYRYAKTLGKGFTGAWMFKLPFTDVEEWYFEAVAWCYKEGITGGTSETTFSPNDSCTRAQIVSFLYRMLNK